MQTKNEILDLQNFGLKQIPELETVYFAQDYDNKLFIEVETDKLEKSKFWVWVFPECGNFDLEKMQFLYENRCSKSNAIKCFFEFEKHKIEKLINLLIDDYKPSWENE